MSIYRTLGSLPTKLTLSTATEQAIAQGYTLKQALRSGLTWIIS